MPRPIALEPFYPERDAHVAPEPDETARIQQAAEEPEPEPEPEPAPESEFDHQAERRECLTLIARTLETIAQDQNTFSTRWVAEAAAAFGAAAEIAMPRMARNGLAALVAEAVERVARQARPPRLELLAAADDIADLEEAVSSNGPTPVELRADDALTPGHVRLEWERGGAEIDAEAVAAAALDQFGRALASKRNMEPEQ